jgi:UDP-N-acetylmuramoyl-L-alanyl-D-glutamate--2,6-diaminopimelate ligase
LAALLSALPAVRLLGPAAAEGELTLLAHDSRAVRPGSGFVALRGERTDGHAFLEAAVVAGARLLVIEESWLATARGGEDRLLASFALRLPLENLVVAVVPDTRAALAHLAAAWYGHPAASLSIVGVTGTNGKTTTTFFLSAILTAAGLPCGRIGTLGAEFGAATWPLANTTPLALEMQALFAAMRDGGARAVAMEVSSHALALERTTGVPFAVGALTNVTRDHLDFHGSFEAYAAAKRTLFERAERSVFGLEDACGAAWADEVRRAGRPVVTYALDRSADLRASELTLRADGSSFVVDGVAVRVALPGRFNVANALAALACARALGIDLALAARALGEVTAVPGRMEHFAGGGIDVIVDYAHTPDALENVLRAARETARGRTLVVFGCGGDRDRGKRPLMGAIARDLADVAIVTSDNPRSESPRAIVDEILAGAGGNALAELDRATAIARAIDLALPGDVVVVAGKGHESYQIVGERTSHFDDREVVRAALAARAERATAVGA